MNGRSVDVAWIQAKQTPNQNKTQENEKAETRFIGHVHSAVKHLEHLHQHIRESDKDEPKKSNMHWI